jgi:hypothetical protein
LIHVGLADGTVGGDLDALGTHRLLKLFGANRESKSAGSADRTSHSSRDVVFDLRLSRQRAFGGSVFTLH